MTHRSEELAKELQKRQEEVDGILGNYSPAWTGADIRRRLEEAGFYICRMPGGVHTGYCPTCGCEPLRGQGV